jgi:prepilin-type N-terminal cleavage/methylation domain-containing protein
MKKLFGKKGFTLVEIVIVIVLLAILAAVAYPKYIDLRDDAHKSTDQAVIGSWRAGVHIYFAKNKKFPDTQSALIGCLEGGLPSDWSVTWNNNDNTATIECDGLPSNGNKASWTYKAADGSFTPVNQHQ